MINVFYEYEIKSPERTAKCQPLVAASCLLMLRILSNFVLSHSPQFRGLLNKVVMLVATAKKRIIVYAKHHSPATRQNKNKKVNYQI